MLGKVFIDIIGFFRNIKNQSEKRIVDISNEVKLLEFEDENILISLDIAENNIIPCNAGISSFEVIISSNGKLILRKEYTGDRLIIKQVCKNFKYRLPELLEVYVNDKRGKNTSIETFA